MQEAEHFAQAISSSLTALFCVEKTLYWTETACQGLRSKVVTRLKGIHLHHYLHLATLLSPHGGDWPLASAAPPLRPKKASMYVLTCEIDIMGGTE